MSCGCTGLSLVSLFDGIGGFPLSFSRAGVPTVATVEIDKAAAGVAADHFPEAKSFSDVTEVTPDDLLGTGFCPVHGILTAGWPCTDLSLAGLRLGLGGARSGLVGEVFRLLLGVRPRWFVLENVPGLLSSVCPCPGGGACGAGCTAAHVVRGGSCGRAVRRGTPYRPGRCMELHGGGMGTVLRSLGECGYGLAYRVLDAQHFGVPQRRRRVVIVGHLGDWAGPAEVLLEPEIGNGNPPQGRPSGSRPSRGTGAGADGARREVVCAIGLSGIGGIGGPDDNAAQGGHLIASTLTAREGKGPDSDATTTLVTHALTAEGSDASEDGAGRGTPLITFGHRDSVGPGGREGVAGTVRDGSGAGGGAVAGPSGVRRLTPTECERLQGFPDGWTATSYGRLQADSPRYRQLGNSIAVPVFEWVARRLVAVDQDGRR